MPKILLMTRAAAAAHVPSAGDALIAIHDSFLLPVSVQEGWAEVLQLGFHNGPDTQVTLPVFSGAQAKSVLLFADRNAHAGTLVVACPDAGARSAAIAKYLVDKYGWPAYFAGKEVGMADWLLYEPHIYRYLYLADRQLANVSRFATAL